MKSINSHFKNKWEDFTVKVQSRVGIYLERCTCPSAPHPCKGAGECSGVTANMSENSGRHRRVRMCLVTDLSKVYAQSPCGPRDGKGQQTQNLQPGALPLAGAEQSWPGPLACDPAELIKGPHSSASL